MAYTLTGSASLGGAYKLAKTPPEDVSQALSTLAWILATHPDAEWRDEAEAVFYAEQAVATAREKTPQLLAVSPRAAADAIGAADAIDRGASCAKSGFSRGARNPRRRPRRGFPRPHTCGPQRGCGSSPWRRAPTAGRTAWDNRP
jgi:hypothetical protein